MLLSGGVSLPGWCEPSLHPVSFLMLTFGGERDPRTFGSRHEGHSSGGSSDGRVNVRIVVGVVGFL